MRKFAEEVVGPKVEAMDEAEKMDPAVIKALFEQGVSHSRYQPQPQRPISSVTRSTDPGPNFPASLLADGD